MRVLLHVFVEIVLIVEHLIAQIADVRLDLSLGVITHVIEQFIERRKRQAAHAAMRWMVI